MATLNQFAGLEVDNIMQFIPVLIGILMMLWMIYKLYKTKSLSPYSGMPALVILAILALLVFGGKGIDLAQWPEGIAVFVGYLTMIATRAFFWPFVIVAVIAQSIRIIGIPQYKVDG